MVYNLLKNYFLLLILVSLTWSKFVLAQNIQSNLSFCESECQCQSPFLTEVLDYIVKPDDKKRSTLQCSLSMEDVTKLLNCVNIMPNLRKKPCNNLKSKPEREISHREKNDNCNFKSNFSFPPTIQVASNAPKDCGYRWKYFNRPEYLKLTREFIKSGKISCSQSMCTSATFLALIAHAKKLFEDKKISKETFDELTIPHRKAYKMLNTSAEPNELVEVFGIGTGYTFDIRDKKFGEGAIPQVGDIAQLWRKNGSGHSVVFKGFIDEDSDGKNDLVCYWSSQKISKGYGNVCEPIDTLSKVLVGHFGGKTSED